MPTYFTHTLGCKVNAYETSALEAELSSAGYGKAESVEKADIIVLNTCFVTSTAGQKSRQHISSFRKKNATAVLLVMGCYSQAVGEDCLKQGADIVLGTANRSKALPYVSSFLESKAPIVDVKESVRKEGYEELGDNAYCEHTRAYLKVQDGCDAFCSYCYIPQLRGNSRSREPRNVIEEAIALSNKGYREIVITGIHTGMYGKDLPGDYRLPDLLRDISAKCPELKRIRISSLEENEIDEAFLDLLRKDPKIVDHLHVPLQSGSDGVLQDMKRRYDTAGFLRKLEAVREIRPDIAITTDLIVGYPTEDDARFEETVAFCQKAGFAEIHVFPFSSRPGTYASTLKDLPGDIKKQRVKRMLGVSKALRQAYKERFYGRDLGVLFEEYDASNGLISGHTENYLRVSVPGTLEQRGTFGIVHYDSSIASD
ncbi:MAG: tRNA (N(6)-L-threonylcarbamoyladenosine(37)-C(2))-methylthiotransferase MtaB [Bacilli bacterium]|nr:tRNA (N(6)-L-threonylcarbamoyladenosine(37)-C(2))-methylthiotransferase MtaB [Bacilli bacterium]